MNVKALTVVSIRVLAIYFIAKSIQILPDFYSALFYFKSHTTSELAIVLGSSVILATGPLLWILAMPMSRWILREIDRERSESGASVHEIHTIAISTAGFIIVTLNLPGLVALFWELYYSSESASLIIGEARTFKQDVITHIIEKVLLVLFGTILMVRAKFWVHVLSKLRNLGYKETPS